MLLVLLTVVTVLTAPWVGETDGTSHAYMVWVFGTLPIMWFAPNTTSGKLCAYMWIAFGILMAAFTVANHCDEKDN